MKKTLAGFLLAAAIAGCGPKHASFVKVDDVALGRVVIYRNGVAFYERRALVKGGTLTVSVPRDKVDDFLKSLTVVDAISKQPLPISIPRQQSDDGTNLVMKLQLPTKDQAEVVLTYVTEAPSWKPSYRVVVGEHRDVLLEGWAIVDNTSGEDWKDVLVGVGSSSALSFRYDLWSVRQVQRETLANEEKFAVAPPTGLSPYGSTKDQGELALGELNDDEIRRPEGHPQNDASKRLAMRDENEGRFQETVEVTGTTSVTGGLAGGAYGNRETKTGHTLRKPAAEKKAAPPPAQAPALTDARVAGGDAKMRQLSQSIVHSDRNIVIEGYTNNGDGDGMRRANDRANIVRNQLIDQGIAPGRIRVVTKVDTNQPERVRLLAEAAPAGEGKQGQQAKPVDVDAQPVGESHFASEKPMTVDKGSSAMISMVRKPTEGEVVYLYDAESERGNEHFAFRAVRFKNPTDSTLETGPVTVYGSERFIGEGLTEPIPPHASAVVPFALDRQIVVEKTPSEDDRLSRLVTLQRGILTAEVQHVKRQKLTVTNRLNAPARIFIRHTVNKGWSLIDAPPAFERIGEAHLFEVDLKPNEVKEVMIAEATPIERTLDLNADVTLNMMKVWVETAEGTPELKEQLRKLLGIHKNLVDLAQGQDSMRRRLADYRQRNDDLHGQILTLTAVKTGGDLMTHLKNKMKEISDLVQKTTIQIVDQEEKIMLARVQFQDALAELALPDAAAKPTASIAVPMSKK